MGTRHLIKVKLNGEIKVAQYGQWDGYPTGQGETIAKFLRGADLNLFRERVAKLRFIKKKDADKKWNEFSKDNSGMTIAESENFKSKYPELHRDTGAGILDLIYSGRATELEDSSASEKVKRGFVIEYCYLIDLDKEEVFVTGYFSKLFSTLSFKEFCAQGTMEELEELEKK